MAKHSLKYYYDVFNSRYFRNSLPKDARVIWSYQLEEDVLGEYLPGYQILTQRVRGLKKGQCRKFASRKHTIRINSRVFAMGSKTVFWTLLHEMVHLKLELREKYGGHGHKFNREMKSLAARGAFNKIW